MRGEDRVDACSAAEVENDVALSASGQTEMVADA